MTETPANEKIQIINIRHHNICNCFSSTIYHTRQFCLRFLVKFLFILTFLSFKNARSWNQFWIVWDTSIKTLSLCCKKILKLKKCILCYYFQYLTHCRSWDLWLLCFFKNGHVRDNCQCQTLNWSFMMVCWNLKCVLLYYGSLAWRSTCAITCCIGRGHQGHDSSTTSPVMSMGKLVHDPSHKWYNFL